MSSRPSRPIYDALHTGQSKCASTYLQRIALLAHPEIDLFFEEHKAACHEYWGYEFGVEPGDFLDQLYAEPHWERKPSSRVRIFSHESLTGNMATGRDARLIADLTFKAFGPIKAFVIVREPYAHIYSVWNQFWKELFEFLCVDSSFVPLLASERAGYSLPLLNLKRRLNRFVKTQHNPSGVFTNRVHEAIRGLGRQYAPLVKSKRKLDARAYVSDEIGQAIRKDNSRLSELLRRDIRNLGYEV